MTSRKHFATMVTVLTGLASLAAACSSASNDGPAPPVPSVDGGDASVQADTGSPPNPNGVTCGEGPWQEVEVTVNKVSADGVAAPSSTPAQVTWSGGCSPLTTGDGGHGTARISTSISPRSVKIVAGDGFLPSLYAEQAVVAGKTERSFFVLPEAFTTLPGSVWNPARGVVLVQIGSDEASGICAAKDGVTLSVKNHPELVVHYLDAATQIGTATATTPYGFALIGDAPPGEKLEIVANKPQCNARTLDAAGIGLAPIEAGVVSIVKATLSDPVDGPKCGAGPFVTMTGGVFQRHASDYSVASVDGATATFSNCAGVTATTRADGTFAVQMTTGATFDLTLTKSGFIPLRFAEMNAGTTRLSGILSMRADDWKPLQPGWSDSGVSLFVTVEPRGKGPCASADGVSFTVKDHPEAVAHYLDLSIPPAESAGATATIRGYAELTGLTAGRYEIVATTNKACKVSTTRGGLTGSINAAVGHLNVVPTWLEDL